VVVIVATCPRSVYSTEAMPLNGTIQGNDLCRQLTVWPPKQAWTDTARGGEGEQAPSQGEHLLREGGSSSRSSSFPQPTPANDTCPSYSGRPLDAFRATDQPLPPAKLLQQFICVKGRIDLAQRPTALASRPTPLWRQQVLTVYPPGTVAVLPTTQGTRIEGDAPGYSWRVNRAHVISLLVDTPSDLLQMKGSYDTANRPSCPVPSSDPSTGTTNITWSIGILVLMDDPWCVSARNCTPDVGGANWTSDPSLQSYMDAYGASDDIVGLFPRARLGCSLGYSVDHSRFNVDLMPTDLSAT